MNDRRDKTRPASQPTDSMAPTVLAPTAVAATVHPTRPYGTAGTTRPAASPGRRLAVRPLTAALTVALGLAALAVIFLRPAATVPPVAPEPVAVLEIAHGAVTMLPAARSAQDPPRLLTLGSGEAIVAGTVIETGRAPGVQPAALTGAAAAEQTGRAAIRLASGQSVRFDADTRVRVASASTLVLERGALYVDSAGGRSGVEVRTTLGVVSDIGTQFEVRLMDGTTLHASTLRVRVREGLVMLQVSPLVPPRGTLQRDEESHEAAAGVELVMADDGTLTRGIAPRYGPDWDWVLEAAPAPEIEGRPLRFFLDWFAREGGWTLRFADPATAELASAIVLHGDLQGLTPGDAARVVFQGSGLGYRLDEEALVVGNADAVRK